MASPRVQELVAEVMRNDLKALVKRGPRWSPPFSYERTTTAEQKRIISVSSAEASRIQEREVFAAQNRLRTYEVTGSILGASALVR